MYDFAGAVDTSGDLGKAYAHWRGQNALTSAGQMAAGGDNEGASNYLLGQGYIQAADTFQKRQDANNLADAQKAAADFYSQGKIREANAALIGAGKPGEAGNLQNVYTSQTNAGNAQADRAREAEERTIGELKNIAQMPDLTPDQWGRTLDLFKTSHPQYAGGIERFRDFSTGLPLLRGKLGIEPSRPKAGPIAVQPGATLFDPASGKTIYTAPPKTPGGLSLPSGVDAKMAEKAVEATDAADSILDGISVLREVSGTQQGDGTYKLRPDMAAVVGPEPEFGGAYKWAKSQVGITGAAGAAQRLDQAKRNVIARVTALENKGQGVISDMERKMYEQFLGDLRFAPNEHTFFDLITQLERVTANIRERHAARRPLGLTDRAASARQDLAVPPDGNLAPPPPQASAPGAGAGSAPPAQGAPNAQPQNVPRITGDADPVYLQLPSGSPYVGPDGHTRVKR